MVACDDIPCYTTLISFGLAVTAAAWSAASPAQLPYEMRSWSQAGSCDSQRQHQSGNYTFDEGMPAQILIQRYLTVVDEVVAGHSAALKVANLCNALGVYFFSVPLPPGRPEPWNPSPPQPVGNVFVALLNEPEAPDSHIRLEANYIPDHMSLSLSFDSTNDKGSASDHRYRDMSGTCPLKMGELTKRLVAAGFSQEVYLIEPSANQSANSDSAISVVFQRGNVSIGATSQGLSVNQHANPQTACVASIDINLSN